MTKKISFILFLISLSVFGQSTVTEWKTLYDSRFSFQGNYEEFGYREALNKSCDQGDIYPMSFYTYGDVLMWQVTGEAFYINRFLDFYEGWINRARPANVIGTGGFTPDNFQYFKDSYLSWVDYPQWTDVRSPDNLPCNFVGGNYGITHFQSSRPTGFQQFSLDEGFGWRVVTTALRQMYLSPNWRSLDNNQSRYQALLDFTQEHIWNKWESRAGDHLYRHLTHMSSHWAKMAMDLFIITGNQKYKTHLDRWMLDMSSYPGTSALAAYPSYGFSNGQLRIHSDGGYTWASTWGDQTAPDNDVGHANSEVETALASIEMGFPYFQKSDIAKFVQAYKRLEVKEHPQGKIHCYIDGTSTASDPPTFRQSDLLADGWQRFGAYDTEIQNQIRVQSPIGGISRAQHFAIGAYNQVILDGGRHIYPELDYDFSKSTNDPASVRKKAY